MPPPTVLFLCTGNSARSQMAEAILRNLAGDQFKVLSAGSEPKGIHPLTVQAMDEIGISLDGHRSKPLSEFLGNTSVKYVIFVCDRAEATCPAIWPFALQSICWPFEDPAACDGTDEERLETFRRVRDQIRERISTWLEREVNPAQPGSEAG